MIVVDASVAAKWLLDEDQTPEAEALLTRRTADLLAPDILLPEVVGAVVRRANMGQTNVEDARASLQRWDSLIRTESVALHRLSSLLMLAAGELALSLRHPVKDCIYLALAIEQKAILVTCDVRLVDKGRRVHSATRALADISSA